MTERYVASLARWAASAVRHDMSRLPGREDLACYGTGFGSWGVQTNQKAFGAFAALAAAPELPEVEGGLDRERLYALALGTLRFSLASHLEGDFHCTDGAKWGHTWISALGIERMMHGVEAIADRMTDDDRALLRRVLVSEADWVLSSYPVVGHPDNASGKNKPESNLWNGALLHRVASLYPDLPQAEAYREQGSRLLINSVSVAADASNEAVVDGKRVMDRFVGDNFFPSYALHHHGYLNVGYMVVCLSNVAMLHFDFKRRGLQPPEALYHRARELWELVKRLLFPDGRLLRIGGDTRVPYTYCQDYLIPTWLLAENLWGERCDGWMSGWLSLVEREQAANGDGSYLSQRCRTLARRSPYYYTRLESDRAVTLSMGAYWGREATASVSASAAAAQAVAAEERFAWSDAFHGAVFHRSPKRIASWVWQAAEKPQGLCLPPDDSSLAEWRWNLAGRIQGLGNHPVHEVAAHREREFPGGFLSCGVHHVFTEKLLGEGMPRERLAAQRTAVAALPDDTTMIVLQHAVSPVRSYAEAVMSLHLQIPNDLFNGGRRSLHAESGSWVIEGAGHPREETLSLDSAWANVEDAIGVVAVYGGELRLYRPGRRTIAPKRYADRGHDDGLGTLYADALCIDAELGLARREAGEPYFDVGAVVRSSETHDVTRAFAAGGGAVAVRCGAAALRAVAVRGADGAGYLFVWNVTDVAVETELSLPYGSGLLSELGTEAHREADGRRIQVEAGDARLFRILETDGGDDE
ncbi:hypothetical protein [Paenibacillus sp.]|uniref:hypothetical protein n=1 Tax=Paenibacillus sp. TaxID=58172 RepID=UPI0028116C6F|nr:hypothetical protein [Paenibacillus sp.]